MPIDKVSDIRRLPRLGKLHLGIKKEGLHGSYPQAVDYFVCPDEVKAVHGETPRELPVMFPSEELEECAPQWYKCYSYSQGLICKGDGKTCRRKVDVETGDYANRDTGEWELKDGLSCEPDICPMMQNKQCRKVMSLLFILPEVPGLGVYQLDTSSFYSIVNMNSQLASDGFLRYFTKGRIAYIPLVLSIEPQVVTPPGVGRKTVHILNVRAKVKLADLIRLSRKSAPDVLLPGVSEEDPPSDLFPEAVLAEAEVRGAEQAAGVVAKGEVLHYERGNPSHPVEDNCNCPKPVPATEIMESESIGSSPYSICYHRTCGGYLCTPPIDCYPGCPHLPLEGITGKSGEEVDKKVDLGGGEAASQEGGDRGAETMPPAETEPGKQLQLGKASVGEAALSPPMESKKSERAPAADELRRQIRAAVVKLGWVEATLIAYLQQKCQDKEVKAVELIPEDKLELVANELTDWSDQVK